MSERPGLVARGMLVLLHGYRRWISPALPPVCRFQPSCSAYAVEAVGVHGAVRGAWLVVRRLLKCAPWHPGGVDPVPPRRDHRTAAENTSRQIPHHEEQAPC